MQAILQEHCNHNVVDIVFWLASVMIVSNKLASIPGRIKIRPGTYCRGDSAHALQITQNMGNRISVVRRGSEGSNHNEHLKNIFSKYLLVNKCSSKKFGGVEP